MPLSNETGAPSTARFRRGYDDIERGDVRTMEEIAADLARPRGSRTPHREA